ncbi:RE1 [Symbiodinium natans]|uniref:RE1 protein n=1 Tax=Symbiodinium natans TaxID=878477 RepID=A0A812LHM1_9DINO|nr:RE1 [Symbiodinium natans]
MVKTLNVYLRQEVPDATYTAILVSQRGPSEWHRDVNNAEGSINWVVPLGDFQGGEIRVLPEGLRTDEADVDEHMGILYPPANHPVSFNPKRRHKVLPHTGNRLVLVAYTPRGWTRLPESTIKELRELGFPVPPLPKGSEPVVRAVSVAYVGDDSSEGDGGLGCTIVDDQQYAMDEKLVEMLQADLYFLSRVFSWECQLASETLREAGPSNCPSMCYINMLDSQIQELQEELLWIDSGTKLDGTVSGHDDERLAKAMIRTLAVKESEKGPQEESEPEVFLQARTIDPQQAAGELEKWVPPLLDEYTGLRFQYEAIYPIDVNQLCEEDVQSGAIEILPAKVVFTRKPPVGKRRARIVACGNFQQKTWSDQVAVARREVYASGLDTIALRIQLRQASLCGWTAAILDIRKAFLYAPLHERKGKGKRIILMPPKILVKAKIIPPSERWVIQRALYGLDLSPAAWSRHRDKCLSQLKWAFEGLEYRLTQSDSEPSLWKIQDSSNALKGLIGVYVDDMLLSACRGFLESVAGAIQTLWETSDIKFAEDGLHFLGVDIRLHNGRYYLTQVSYVTELLNRHPEIEGTASTPYPAEKDQETEEENIQMESVRLAQGLIGELTWLATKTRLDIAWAVNRASQLSSKRPSRAIAVCQNIVRYLRGKPDLGLVYGPKPAQGVKVEMTEGTLEVATDASFAPLGEKSQTGVVLKWAGAVIGWVSSKQTFVCLSSAEAELYAAMEGMVMTDSVSDLVRELVGQVAPALYSDNVACTCLIALPAGSWRTRHLRLRARRLHERIENEELQCFHLPGEVMTADLLTKSLSSQRMQKLLDLAGVVQLSHVLRCAVVVLSISRAQAQPSEDEEDEASWVTVVAFGDDVGLVGPEDQVEVVAADLIARALEEEERGRA